MTIKIDAELKKNLANRIIDGEPYLTALKNEGIDNTCKMVYAQWANLEISVYKEVIKILKKDKEKWD